MNKVIPYSLQKYIYKAEIPKLLSEKKLILLLIQGEHMPMQSPL